MRPTALLTLRAGGIHLRLLYAFRLRRAAVATLHFWKPLHPGKRGAARTSLPKRNLEAMPLERGWRSGTQHPKPVVIVTVVWIVVVAEDRPRIVIVVVPRAATQNATRCLTGNPTAISGCALSILPKPKKSIRLTAKRVWGLVLRTCAWRRTAPPVVRIHEKGDATPETRSYCNGG